MNSEKILDFPCQYNLFETREQSERRALIEHIQRLEESITRIRKGQFSKIGANTKRIDDLETRLSILEKGICQNAR